MPLLSTSGSATVKGFGFGIGQAGVLTTYTFPGGTSTWTAPAGVTKLVTAVGRGQNGAAPYFFTGTPAGSTVQTFDPPLSGTALDWSTVYSEGQAALAVVNTGAPNFRNINGSSTYRNVNTSNQVSPPSTFTSPNWVTGTAVLSPYGAAKTSGPVLYSEGVGAWEVLVSIYVEGVTGSSTTGFGLTFPGGTPSVPSAPTTTFTNVTVVPGTTYTIQNYQSLVITYYV